MKNIKALLYIVKIDVLYNAKFRLSLSCALYAASELLRVFDRRRADSLLMKAHHYSDSAAFQTFLNPKIKKLIDNTAYVQFLTPAVNIKSELLLHKYLFLAKPYKSSREKGVIFLMYGVGFNAFFRQYDVARLLRDYYLVLEPEWAGYCKPEILTYAKIDSCPVIVESTEQLDFVFIKQLNSNFIPVDFGASDWLDPNMFHPITGISKKYDCIMVCDWFNYKRHYVLLRALSKIKEYNLKALLVSNATGIVDTLKNVARYYGVLNNITFMQCLPPERLNVMYNESKANLLLSYKEGSNKTLFEGMFANTPAILIKNNIGVNKRYINDETGKLIDEKDLPETLVMFSRDYAKFNPRQWVMDNISCQKTTQKLNTLLKDIALRNGEEWTEDMRIKVNVDGMMRCLHPEDTVIDGHLNICMRSA